MAETAAHLVDHVFPQVPVRQWVLALPKRLRYFVHRDPELTGRVLNVWLRGVHSLKHTFGRRLRAAGVPLETRRVLLGHKSRDITSYYSTPELKELIDAANRVCGQGDVHKTPTLTLLKRKVLSR